MLKDGIIRFIKAHGIAVLIVAAIAAVLKIVLHYSFILSFLVLLVLYFVIGFAIDLISEKIRLNKALKSKKSGLAEPDDDLTGSSGNSTRRSGRPAVNDANNGSNYKTERHERIFEVPESDDTASVRNAGKKGGLRKLSTDMRSIIAASPSSKEKENKVTPEDSGFFRKDRIRRSSHGSGSSGTDYMRDTDFTYSRFSDRNKAQAEREAVKESENPAAVTEAETVSLSSGDVGAMIDDIYAAAENAASADPQQVARQETAAVRGQDNDSEAGQAEAGEAPDEKKDSAEALNEPGSVPEPENKVEAPAPSVMPDTDSAVIAAAAAVPDETVFDVTPDIAGDTEFSENISDAVDKLIGDTQHSIIRRNRYIVTEKSTPAAPPEEAPAAEENTVRSHISSDIDVGNTLFGIPDEDYADYADDADADMVNADSSKVNALFSGRKKEKHVKPSLEEYRRRTEKLGTSGRSLTKEILEGKSKEGAPGEKTQGPVSLPGPEAAAKTENKPENKAEIKEEKQEEARSGKKEEKAETEKKPSEDKEEKAKAPEEKAIPEVTRVYEKPPVDLLSGAKKTDNIGVINSEDDPKAQKLISTLESFGVGAKIIGVMRGPAVTRYELQPNPGVKVSRIVALSDDIALNLASTGVRIEAPIPGKEAVGIEVPNSQVEIVALRQVIESEEFQNSQSPLSVALGRDIAGKNIVADIAKMPHLLIAGATGSGKSVCINTIVASVLFKAGPEDVRMIMIDPKIVELGVYNGIPHLLVPVVTNPKKAAGALSWAVAEMENRYTVFSQHNVRDIKAFNVLAERNKSLTKMPQILIIIDELADLMMVAAKEIEDSIIRLSQKARAAGLHIIIATQRPSVDVITGLIKANIPSRIAFAVTSQIDSRTILDGGGAEKLLGRGDMLFHPIGMAKPLRVQGAFVSDSEIEALADNVRNSYGTALYSDEIQSSIDQKDKPQGGGNNASESNDDEQDSDYEMIDAAAQLALEYKQLSTSFLQRKLRLGYSRASRIVDTLESEGLISEADGSKPRQLLMTKEEWEKHIADSRGESV